MVGGADSCERTCRQIGTDNIALRRDITDEDSIDYGWSSVADVRELLSVSGTPVRWEEADETAQIPGRTANPS